MFSVLRNSPLSRLGLRFQLVFLFSLVFGVLFFAFSVGMYLYIAQIHRHEFDTALYNYVVGVSHAIGDATPGDRAPLAELYSGTEVILPFSRGDVVVQVRAAKGDEIFRSKNLGTAVLPMPGRSEQSLVDDRGSYEDVRLGSTSYRMVSHFFERPAAGPMLVQAAVPMLLLDRQREGLLVFLSVAVPLTLLLAGVSGLAFSRRAMAPVSAMTSKAREIEAHRLSERIPVPAARGEIGALATTLNGLLDRLERAFRSQEAFIADASHQLKTPLSVLKVELQMLGSSEKTGEEIAAFVSSARQEVDYLIGIVEDLLLLARVDTEGFTPTAERLRLDEKLVEWLARLSRVAETRDVRLLVDLHPAGETGESGFECSGDPELLRALLENLVDNAVKYSPLGGTVHVALQELPNSLRLHVSDAGPGIAPVDMPSIFRRFYRAEEARRTTPGTGLGLSIVQRIAELHGAVVAVTNDPKGGAHFTVTLPRG